MYAAAWSFELVIRSAHEVRDFLGDFLDVGW
jgi:hypothetical protein